MNVAIDALALGMVVGNSIWCVRKINQSAELVLENAKLLRRMNAMVSDTHDKVQALERYVDQQIEDVRSELPSIEC